MEAPEVKQRTSITQLAYHLQGSGPGTEATHSPPLPPEPAHSTQGPLMSIEEDLKILWPKLSPLCPCLLCS